MFFIIFHIDVTSAFSPDMRPSWLNSCSYEINWNKFDWSIYNSWLKWPLYTICNTDIDFSTISDWVYDFTFKAYDNTSPANVTTSTKTYKIDTKPVNCVLNTITLYWIDNQYYDKGNLYYKGVWWSGKFELNISCTDPGNKDYISNINNINFPNLIGVDPKLNTNNVTSTSKLFDISTKTNSYIWFTLTYDWDTTNTVNDSTNILWDLKDFVYDYAWNSGSLVANNTKLIIRNFDDDWTWIPIKTINWITSLKLNKDSLSPSLLTSIDYKSWNDWNWAYLSSSIWNTSRFFSALENRNIRIPTINDAGSWLRKTILKFEKYDQINNFDSITYTWSTLNWDNKVATFNQKIFSHDFRDVSNKLDYNNSWYRAYSWIIESYDNLNKKTNDNICDMVGNCTYVSTPDFKVVANVPDKSKSIYTINNNANIENNYSGKVANYKDNYNINITYNDKYNNYISPVSWVKSIVFNNIYDNTLGKNKISNAIISNNGNWVSFVYKNTNNLSLSTNGSYKNITLNSLDTRNEFDNWELDITIKSWVPTYDEYKDLDWNNLYWSASAKLLLKDLIIKVENKLTYDWVWENLWLDFVNNDIDFRFSPALTFWVDSIYPLVEWQEKKITLDSTKNINSTINSYELETYIWTKNSFMDINNLYFKKDTKYNWNNWYVYIDKNRLNLWDNWIIWFIPKTNNWITSTDRYIAMYSDLEYNVWTFWSTITVDLPWVQTWFKDFWIHKTSDFNDSSKYDQSNWVTLSEIQITWITQTKNKWLDKNTAWSIVTDTAKTSFNDISKISLYDLKTNIKSNLNKYLKWSDLSKASVWNTTDIITINNINNFDSSKWLILKWWSIFYVKNRDVVINCGSNPCKISWKKTIIVDWWNLTIKSDMYYDKAVSNSILWLVVIGKNKDWYNWQVKIDENITNGVWIVYSEWPIVSVNSAWIKYDWTNVETNLKNQLYWKWSFATKNTVWWAIKFDSKTSCPFGTPEYEKSSCTTEIAQWYDLIYLRRYAVIKSWSKFIPINWPVKIAWQVSFNEDWSKSWWDSNLINSSNISSPLIIDYDSKLQSIPPYLFEKSK